MAAIKTFQVRNAITRQLTIAACLCGLVAAQAASQDRNTKVRNDREALKPDETWIYNDLDAAFAEAQKSNRPLMVVLRCIPCEACSQFDKELLSQPAEVKDLLKKFVCVRVVQGNHLDLALFQFDYDQSFHTMFLNADRTIYGRYGTRSQRPEQEDMTIAGLRAAMLAVLDLHQDYPKNKAQLAAKTGPAPEFAVPEQMPALKGKYGALLDYEGEVVKSCIHCHQIRDAERNVYRTRNQELPDDVLYPFPLPETIGLKMNPDFSGRVAGVEAGSAADRGGLKVGDDIVSMSGQPIISTADIQWVLHRATVARASYVEVRRGDKVLTLIVPLEENWKKRSDISWRVSTWQLRGLATGGLVFEPLPQEDLAALKLPADKLALRIKHVGLYGMHAAGKNAGFQKGDVLVALDGDDRPQSESQLIAQLIRHPAGSKVPVTLMRSGKRMELQLPIQ